MKRQANTTQFFYQGGKLTTVRGPEQQRSIFRHSDIPLAEQASTDAGGNGLLATDDKGSVLTVQGDDEEKDEHHAFSAYGHNLTTGSGKTRIGFNGEPIDLSTGCYLLGNGYRAYTTRTGRFQSPDSLSPFDRGGINAYAYCANDPVNAIDPTGRYRVVVEQFRQIKRQPVTIVTRLTTGISVRVTKEGVRQRKSQYHTETSPPKTHYQHEVSTLHIKRIGTGESSKLRVVKEQHLPTYRENGYALKYLKAEVPRPFTEATASIIALLESHQKSFLRDGAELFNQAMDPQNLTTYIRGVPRITEGSSQTRPPS
ncbi:RHS repeat-associated core domain-containing protein [Pseudomonas sp. NPDC089554]|uniref:RHS repeat-associated core domain-containing protein n=1 Tax=Pseudomonas sp. NPDC089554 TaxID=3390653 RepID=UPI003CFEDF1F